MPKTRRSSPTTKKKAVKALEAAKPTKPARAVKPVKRTSAKRGTSTSSKQSRPRAATTPRAAGKSMPYSEGKWAAAFERAPGERKYWLVKSEPEVFSWDDLERAPDRTTCWDGVRNFAARNFLRDGMKLGDRVAYYHSSSEPQCIMGECEIVREGYPDPTAWDRKSPNHDPTSDPSAPTWFMVDVRAVERWKTPVTLAAMKTRPELAQMALLRIGRMSVTPVTQAEWNVLRSMGA